jgi:uncharacterized protein with FMN-binding domain
MLRAPFVLGATAAGTAALLGFHAHGPAAATTRPAAAATTTTTTTTTQATTSSGTSSSGTSTKSTTYTGAVEQTRYGPVQVKVTVRNGRVTDLTAVQLPANDPRSVQIGASAEPLLRQEALQAQSASIDAVSGATFTSAGYQASLASALGQAGIA